jgi:hypothetical protein
MDLKIANIYNFGSTRRKLTGKQMKKITLKRKEKAMMMSMTKISKRRKT